MQEDLTAVHEPEPSVPDTERLFQAAIFDAYYFESVSIVDVDENDADY